LKHRLAARLKARQPFAGGTDRDAGGRGGVYGSALLLQGTFRMEALVKPGLAEATMLTSRSSPRL
jgi:hypothetical protein